MLLYFFYFSAILFSFLLLKFIMRNSNKVSLESLKESPELFLRFLDTFYITNIYYTIFCSFCYFFYTIFIIIFIRYIFLGYQSNIYNINMAYLSFNFIIFVILNLILLILINSLIEVLFYKEVLKLYLYVCQSINMHNFMQSLYRDYCLYNFLGPINLFLYCVSTLKVIPTDDDDDYQEFYYYKYIYEKDIVIIITRICVKYATKFIGILWIFQLMQYICNLMYEYIRWYRFLYFVFLIIFFIILFYDFIHFKVYYTYYYFFIFCIITFVFKYFKFIHLKDGNFDRAIMKYFYKNTLDYNIQRIYINNMDIYYYRDIKNKSKENRILLNYSMEKYTFGTLMEYIFYNLQKGYYNNKRLIENQKKQKYRFIIFFIVFIFILIVIYFLFYGSVYVILLSILNIKIPAIILTLPTAFIVFISTKIYLLPKNATEDFIEYYIYNKNYARIFVLLVILQSIILGIFFYYTNILEFFNDNALWNNLGLSIYRNYSVNEKQQYFMYIFDKFFIKYYYEENWICFYNVENLKILVELKQIILNNITENTKIKDIQEVLDYIMLNSLLEYNMTIYPHIFKDLNIKNIFEENENCLMPFVKNTINILVFWKFFICYLDVYMQIRIPFSPAFFNIVKKSITNFLS